MENDLVKKFTDLIMTTPGIVSIEETDNSIYQPVIIEDLDKNQIDVKIAIIVDRNTSISNISKQIYNVINYACKKEKKILNHLNLEIKGVR